ncbi:c97df2f1-31d5-4e7c-8bdf-ee1687686820 [Thermothielavioides terrestris]|uniref:C97df2f1-31d5-4e7c-8bdf-ee1687686820 n=1 Tax=Thermothielavioides terrestris TaxID=2587410 RepID=A0A3S5CWT7_9PEZI|nr:c97df2f1-31d5-4e7c-8bdf-ee1687686820 [Thermothielavioides terrestris]
MPRPALPIQDLPAWVHLNEVSFNQVEVASIEGKGYGVVCKTNLSAGNAESNNPALISVPHDLVLNSTAVSEYAKEDKNFRQLLDASGRADVLLFLLVQTAMTSRPGPPLVGVSNPWTEYLRFLPETVPVPTLWTEDERLLLQGTSLEAAVNAKISALDAEFAQIVEKSSDIACWRELLWDGGTVSFTDWIRLDALYRSRCLELPVHGESMVPCIDMLNHSATPSAYYDENPQDDVVLLLRPGISLAEGDEITISYGDAKSAAEMLFSYGFIDPRSTADSLVLPLSPFPDDPLAKAKLVAFGQAPKIHVARESDGSIRWRSEFAYLMCVNEEDGLEFRILQQTDGAQQLCVFWQDEDVTDRAAGFESLIQTHPLAAILRLRVMTVIQKHLQNQLQRLQSSTPPDRATPLQREDCFRSALLLRQIETRILDDAIKILEQE